MNSIQSILIDCEDLIKNELELEQRFNEKTLLIKNQQQKLIELPEQAVKELGEKMEKLDAISQKQTAEILEAMEKFTNDLKEFQQSPAIYYTDYSNSKIIASNGSKVGSDN